ncbi:MAG: hypothetical protein HY651_05225 [Acidobacteria bacterium]|nr:hypothetical protein [Acidobacteriota bacterium]
MSKLVLFCVFATLLTPMVQAQDAPKAEVFAGFSVLSVKFDGSDREALYGWQVSIAGNPTPVLGLVADFAGHYKSIEGEKVKVHEFLFGPQINARAEKANGFVHFLLGGIRASGGGESENGFGLGIGGGVDVKAGQNTSIRVIQFDWVPARFNGEWSRDVVRFGFGVVFGGGS